MPSPQEVEAARETLKQHRKAQQAAARAARAAARAAKAPVKQRLRSLEGQEIWTLLLKLPADLKPGLARIKSATGTTFVELVTRALRDLLDSEQDGGASGG